MKIFYFFKSVLTPIKQGEILKFSIKTLTFLLALYSSINSIEIQAIEQSLNDQLKEKPLNQASLHASCRSCRRLFEGLQGPTGPTGPAGSDGLGVVTGIYADAFLQQNLNEGPTSFPLFPSPIVFNNLNAANGVDTSQLLSNGSMIIQSPGDYLITYYVYGNHRQVTSPPPLEPTFISLILTRALTTTIVPETTIGNNAKDPTILASGQIILNLQVGDTLQLSAIETFIPISLQSLATEPLKIASLTVYKLN